MAEARVNFWRSLSTRITLLVVTVSIAVFVFLVWLTLYYQQLENRNLAERELRTLSLSSQATLNRIIRYDYPELAQEVVAELEVHRRVSRALIFNEQGSVVFSNLKSEVGRLIEHAQLELPEAFSSPAGKFSLVVYEPGLDRFYSKTPLVGRANQTQEVATWTLLMTYEYDTSLKAAIYQRRWTLAGESLLVLILASLLRVYLQRRLTRPLQLLQQGVLQLRLTNSDVDIALTDNDELGQMARTIEQIARDRSQYLSDLKNLNTAIEQSNECVIITNIEGEIEYVNRAFSDVTGYTKGELIGQNPRILQSGATAKTTYERLWNKLKAGETWRGELLNKRKDGSNYVVWATITPVLDENDRITHFIGVEEDITERKADEEKLHFLAYYEPLTSLPNRFHLSELMQQVLAAHDGKHYGALLLVDMDRLQHINDARGYEFGSELIKRFAERLKQELKGREHTLAHLGADAFAVLLPEDASSIQAAKNKAEAVGQLLLATTEQPFHVMREELKISASIGCVIYPETNVIMHSKIEAERIIRSAETAMHQAKHKGGNSFEFYKAKFSQQVQQQFEIEKQLRHAISKDELELHLQSQCLHSGEVVSAEALVRWNHSRDGMISPGKFIPVAEQSDLIVDVDRWMLTRVCQLLADLQKQGKHLSISVNISARHFRKSDFEDWIDALIKEYEIPRKSLVLEVTEGVLIDDVSDVVAKMQGLNRQGVEFSIDDFGTGYSSLSYISQLPVHELKIDQSFVQSIGDRRAGDGVIETVISIANHMSMRVVAEGVETKKQAEFLFKTDANVVMQGFYYARPVEATQWRASLK